MAENPFAYDGYDQAELPEFSTEPPAHQTNTTHSITSNPQLSKKAKLEQLKAREAELLKKQDQLKVQAAEVTLVPNWPSFYPIVRYNIDNDLSASAKPTVQNAFYGLVSISIACFVNVLAVLLVTGLSQYSKTSALVFAIIQGFATVYVGLNFSYMGIYEACKRRDVPFRWTIYQFCFVGWCGYRTVGFPNSGSVGFAVLLDLIANNSKGLSKFIAFINSALSAVALYFEIRAMVEAQKYQKVSGRVDEVALNPAETV
ncbi:hypothetical protein TVAG_303730 [Trichomonas vaginalis G3]|uniref:Secretory carrier membrane protein n=1 Tax=Trichomonas vaginalis (strain ATCC PRA-98 / G3) TaxID=412133 RepID=A2DR55_TRIV3|nr:protein transport [Trichomonas vaginalis G3]EAY17154.1 hypothetical protein TVAG_303730 [Trichomonas vaginalis G3]KAI5508873.1 protein transport [Trichomonas vaginalis G3]|eukprot:XP_001329377.1 hypothetical protein [Trichomonas vaginalis G3]